VISHHRDSGETLGNLWNRRSNWIERGRVGGPSLGFDTPSKGRGEGVLRLQSNLTFLNERKSPCRQHRVIPMPGLDILIGALEAHDCDPREWKGQWTAKCPSHDSKGRKLGVKADGDTVLFQCFAGCLKEDILFSLGLGWKDLLGESDQPIQRRREPWERHLEAAVRHGAVPKWEGNGVYSGVCSCGGELYVGRAGAACSKGCQISLDPVEPRWVDPVEDAIGFGADLKPSGQGVFVGQCPSCGGWLSAGPGGASCESNCPIREVGFFARTLRDSMKGVSMQQRTITVLGCVEKKRGEKNGRQWVLYNVHANDEQGQPIQHELVSFSEIPQGTGTYWIEVKESQFGTQYTIKQPSQVQLDIEDLKKRVSALEGSPVPPATVAAQTIAAQPAPAFTPKVVEAGEVPF